MIIGIISYDYLHLKTEQLVINFYRNKFVERIKIYALPFKARKERPVLIPHRPDMSKGLPTEVLAELDGVEFVRWDGIRNLSHECDVFISLKSLCFIIKIRR